ncbi:MAG: hypothetical protein P4L50_23735 [Anaerolineaceae bacterium]|nr:hypothetical protein [Anaerolineaceae bacterium]
MRIGRQVFTSIVIVLFIVGLLLVCNSMYETTHQIIPDTGGERAAQANIIGTPNPASVYAQATIDSGQGQLLDLSRQATESSLVLAQTERAAAQETQVYNDQQKLALDFQATQISRNIRRAAATQEFLTQQANISLEATSTAQRSAAEATQSAEQAFDTQTAQAQIILNFQGSQTVQAAAAMTAFPFTATPFAATQAAALANEANQEQQSFINRIINPLVLILAVFDLILIIIGIVLFYRRYLIMPEAQPSVTSINKPATSPEPSGEGTVFIETVNSADLPIAEWINDAENQLAGEERHSP